MFVHFMGSLKCSKVNCEGGPLNIDQLAVTLECNKEKIKRCIREPIGCSYLSVRACVCGGCGGFVCCCGVWWGGVVCCGGVVRCGVVELCGLVELCGVVELCAV